MTDNMVAAAAVGFIVGLFVMFCIAFVVESRR